jgi:Tfp pilus assembly protein PilE
MKRSGGFTVVELLIIITVLAIVSVSGYYVYSHHHQPAGHKNASVTSPAVTSNIRSSSVKPAPAASGQNSFKINEFGIELVNVPPSIQDLLYTYYPSNTDANFTQAQFTTVDLAAKDNHCSIGLLNRYPGKYNSSVDSGPAVFVKQFNGFWIAEIDVGVPCSQNAAILDLQNTQITTFKQFVTKPANLQPLP